MRTRHLFPVIAVCVGALLAACGGDDSASDGTSGSGATATTAASAGSSALAYAKCMREHGVDFPDPQIGADGRVMITPGEGGSADDPDLPEAQEACGDLLQQGGNVDAVDPEQEAEVQEQALAMAQCMREHGIDFPDPEVNGGRVLMGQGGGDPNSPEFQEAIQECQASSGLGGGSQP